MGAAVAAEHRDRFGEIVERLALHPDQAVKPPRQIEALGDVIEQIGDAAFRIGRGDDADRAAVGQVPGVLVGLHRAIGLVQLGLPGPEIRLLRQLARGAQPVEHAGIIGVAVEKDAVEIPQPAVGIVVEGQPPLAVEHCDAGRQLIQGAAMGFHHPIQCRAQRGGLAGVDGDAGAAAADIHRAHIVDAPLAADHDRQSRAEGRSALQRPLHVAAVAAVEQFEVAIDRIRDAGGLGRPRIGGVGVAEAALGVPGPDRPGGGRGEAAQRVRFLPTAP